MKPTPLLLICSLGFVFTMFGLAQPTITVQPKSQSASLGANVTFSVRASGTPPLSYQWRLNDSAIPGATTNSLALTNVQSSDAGSYKVAVTDATGTATSQPAVLGVDPTFIKITSGAIVTDSGLFSASSWADYDNDGFLDLLVGNFEGRGKGQGELSLSQQPGWNFLSNQDFADWD